MANLQTLKVLRGMLRGIIAEPREDKFTDIELNLILSLAQFDVARRLRKINKDWFSTEAENMGAIGYDHSVHTIPSDCLEIISVEAAADGAPIRIFDSSKKNLLLTNSMYTPSASYMFGFHIGNELHIYPAIMLIKILYVQTPVEISGENDVTIIPVRFVQNILAYAKMICAPKTQHINPQLAAQEYDDMYLEIEALLKKTDVKAKEPDIEEKK